MASLDQARAAKQAAAELVSKFAAVVGVGITKTAESYGVKVNVETPVQSGQRIPAALGGVPIKIEVVGRVRKRTGKS